MILKILMITGGSLIGLVLLVGLVFINTSPEFGGSPSDEQIAEFKTSGHYEKDEFINDIPTSMDMGFLQALKIMREFAKVSEGQEPEKKLPVEKLDSLELTKTPIAANRVTWFGHSAFLIEMNGRKILIDPMLGEVPAPHPLLGNARFTKELPISIEELPEIDIVIISHDHYDHLDYGSIKKLKNKVKEFYMPLGVGSHLLEWGIEADRIHELNWWEESNTEDFKIVCTPSRHFSGRGLFDRMSTLWGSWIIQSDSINLYFSGDGGYGPHFKEIGEKYGPFDFAMMECGQYNENWKDIHMMPEQTAQAAIDVKAKIMMPIHWGSFKLSLHSWTDPVVRVRIKAEELKQEMVAPKIGESIDLNKLQNFKQTLWWEGL